MSSSTKRLIILAALGAITAGLYATRNSAISQRLLGHREHYRIERLSDSGRPSYAAAVGRLDLTLIMAAEGGTTNPVLFEGEFRIDRTHARAELNAHYRPLPSELGGDLGTSHLITDHADVYSSPGSDQPWTRMTHTSPAGLLSSPYFLPTEQDLVNPALADLVASHAEVELGPLAAAPGATPPSATTQAPSTSIVMVPYTDVMTGTTVPGSGSVARRPLPGAGPITVELLTISADAHRMREVLPTLWSLSSFDVPADTPVTTKLAFDDLGRVRFASLTVDPTAVQGKVTADHPQAYTWTLWVTEYSDVPITIELPTNVA